MPPQSKYIVLFWSKTQRFIWYIVYDHKNAGIYIFYKHYANKSINTKAKFNY